MLHYTLKGKSEGDIVDILFENRGILNKEVILNPSEKSILNPFIYDNMEAGVKLLNENINNEIVILVDSDTDGFSSAAEFYIGIKKINPEAKVTYIIHEDKTHGLTPKIMAKVMELNPSLIIVPDAGSNDYEQHKILDQKGIKVLVVDHHDCEGFSQDAIVINNQLSEEGNKTLSGGGMVLKFFEAYDVLYGTEVAKEIIDLAALAMIGDSMLMIEEETRYYCKKGMFAPKNPFIRHLGGMELSFKSVAWNISPVINAVIRMGDVETKSLLFEALIGDIKPMEIEKRGKGLVKTNTLGYLDTMVNRYRSRQRTQVNKIVEKGKVIDTKLCVIYFADGDFNRNLSGLVAGKLATKYNKPALVLSKTETLYAGSARVLHLFNMRSLMEEFTSTDYATGHEAAFGIGIKHENMKLFLQECNKHTAPEVAEYNVDKVYSGYINSQDIFRVLDYNKEWSKGFEQPIFAVELNNVSIKNMDFYARNTVCIKTISGPKMLKFNCSEKEIFEINSMETMNITAIVEFEIDKFGKPCVSIKDWSIENASEDTLDDWWF
jgi:single-stranded-DNA-specific exonuclease